MDSEETVVWVPTPHKVILLVLGLLLTAVSAYFLLTEANLLFDLPFGIGSVAVLFYALTLFLAPKPTLIFDAAGLSTSRSTTKTPWNHVDTIERVVVGGYGRTSYGIAIRLVENSEFKSDTARTIFDWDRKEKYDIVVWQYYCDLPLDDLQRRLLKLKKDYSDNVGGGQPSC